MNKVYKRPSPWHNASSRLVLGIFIVIIGSLALIDNLGIFDTERLLSFWPVIFIILGALHISKTHRASGFFYGGLFLVIGTAMTLENLGYIVIHWNQWWPVLIILVGVSYILKSLRRNSGATDHVADSSNPYTIVSQSDTDYIEIFAVMSGNKANNGSQNFLGGAVTTVMGSAEIDLRKASIQSEAVIEVHVLMGGIEIFVPNDWIVVTQGLPVMGGMEDNTVPPMNSTKRLIISGVVVMGGVEIKN